MGNLIPNTTQLPNVIIDRHMRKLSDTALRLLLIIARKTFGWIEDSSTRMRKQEDWIAYSQLMEFSGRERGAIAKALRELEEFNLIEIRDQSGIILKTKEERLGRRLFYRFKTSSESEQVTISNPTNQFGKRSSESEHTKETNTKTSTNVDGGIVKKQPSCPLMNGSPLKVHYPNGHSECLEYLFTFESERKRKFINRPKQFLFIHKILRANVGFQAMDKIIGRIEKRYGRNNWDFATLSNWLDKGGDF